jgi:adenylate cyclase
MSNPKDHTPHAEQESQVSPKAQTLIDEVANWLIAQALVETDFEGMYEGCCERLFAAGVPLWRGHIAYSVLHPLYASMDMTWIRGRGLELYKREHGDSGTSNAQFKTSPLYHMIKSRIPYLRRRLIGSEALLDFPVLSEFRDQGATDYLGYIIPFGDSELDGLAGSWATDRPSGFSDHDIKALLRLQQRLGVACKMRIKDQIARNVVTAYLGPDAGLRVLSGQIRRGEGETIRAAIWYSDLRDSTRLAETLSRDDFIQLLNIYFECTAGAVLAHGGDILNFIGDAVLAIFPIQNGRSTEQQACKHALAASRDAQQRLAAINENRKREGAEPLSFGLGLHVGEVLFGNIGVPERVSFSVIGPTVNEVARLEALTKELGLPILVSENFARYVTVEWVRLGRHKLRGVGEPIEVCAPADNVAASQDEPGRP